MQDYISFRELTYDEKKNYLLKAAEENRLEFIFRNNTVNDKTVAKLKIYGAFYKNELMGFYYFYDLHEQTLKIAFGYFGFFTKNHLLTIVHVLTHITTLYGIIGVVDERNKATLKLCRKYLNAEEFIFRKANNNNADRHLFYWQKQERI